MGPYQYLPSLGLSYLSKYRKKVCAGFKQAWLKSNKDIKIYIENIFLLNVILHNIKEAY